MRVEPRSGKCASSSNDCPPSGPVLQTWLSHCSQNFIQWTGTSAGHFDCRLRSASGGRERNYDEVPYKLQSALEQRLRGHLRHRRTDLVQEPKMHHADGRPYPASCSSAQLDSPLLSIRDPGVRWPVVLWNACQRRVDRPPDPPSAWRATDSSASTTSATGIVVTISTVEVARRSGYTASRSAKMRCCS
jgi:hypothetical protein